MDLLTPDWEQARPDETAINAFWREVSIRPIGQRPPEALSDFVSTFEELMQKGGVLLSQFTIERHPVLCWFTSRNRIDECDFPDRFLAHPAVKEAMPEHAASIRPVEKIRWFDPLMLDGLLASRLVWGGAYARFEKNRKEAKHLGIAAADALIQERFGEVIIYETCEGWSDWFKGVSWDSSLFVLDRRNALVTVLCATDTD